MLNKIIKTCEKHIMKNCKGCPLRPFRDEPCYFGSPPANWNIKLLKQMIEMKKKKASELFY